MKVILFALLLLIEAWSPAPSQAQTTFHQYPYSSLTRSGGWSTAAWTGSRTGNITQTSSSGQTITLTATDTDFYLVYAQAEYYDAYMQVTVDGVNTKTINLRGQHNTNAQGVAQEKITVKPLALGLSNASHTITLTTLNAVQYKIDSIESKSGTATLTSASILGAGDSITQKGGELMDINGIVGQGNYTGWFTQLAAYLGKTPIDIGEGSGTTDQIIIQFYDYARQASSVPSTITFMAGMNDCLSYAAVNQTWVNDRFVDAVDLIRSISPDAFLVLGKVTATEGSFAGAMTQINAWNSTIAAVASAKSLSVAPTSSYPGAGYTFDGVHPTYAGHVSIASAFETITYPSGGTPTAATYRATMRATFR